MLLYGRAEKGIKKGPSGTPLWSRRNGSPQSDPTQFVPERRLQGLRESKMDKVREVLIELTGLDRGQRWKKKGLRAKSMCSTQQKPELSEDGERLQVAALGSQRKSFEWSGQLDGRVDFVSGKGFHPPVRIWYFAKWKIHFGRPRSMGRAACWIKASVSKNEQRCQRSPTRGTDGTMSRIANPGLHKSGGKQ
jgi:hypothetical protein